MCTALVIASSGDEPAQVGEGEQGLGADDHREIPLELGQTRGVRGAGQRAQRVELDEPEPVPPAAARPCRDG